METTKEYDSFKQFRFNRSVDESRIGRLAQSIKKHGFLLPILVTRSRVVLDGQHRLEAAKRINAPISFIYCDVPEDNLPLLVSNVNALSKNWTLQNYQDMWSQLNRPAYMFLEDIQKKYGITNVSHLLKIIGFRRISLFKSGDYTLTPSQMERLESRAGMYNDLATHSKIAENIRSDMSFKVALTYLIIHDEYLHEIMLSAIKRFPGDVQKCSNYSQYISIFERIFNACRPRQKNIFFSR